MASHTARLSRVFTPEYVKRINAQIVHPAQAVVVKPNELGSSLSRPLHLSAYEPDRDPAYFAATLAFGIIKGHPFMDGNKRTAHEYARAMGLPGLPAEAGVDNDLVVKTATKYMDVAAGKLDMDGLVDTVKPLMHSTDTLTLTDIETGFSMNLRAVLDVVLHDPND